MCYISQFFCLLKIFFLTKISRFTKKQGRTALEKRCGTSRVWPIPPSWGAESGGILAAMLRLNQKLLLGSIFGRRHCFLMVSDCNSALRTPDVFGHCGRTGRFWSTMEERGKRHRNNFHHVATNYCAGVIVFTAHLFFCLQRKEIFVAHRQEGRAGEFFPLLFWAIRRETPPDGEFCSWPGVCGNAQ